MVIIFQHPLRALVCGELKHYRATSGRTFFLETSRKIDLWGVHLGQLDFSPRLAFLEGSQLEWAKRDILSVELEDRGEAADTFQIVHAVIQVHPKH